MLSSCSLAYLGKKVGLQVDVLPPKFFANKPLIMSSSFEYSFRAYLDCGCKKTPLKCIHRYKIATNIDHILLKQKIIILADTFLGKKYIALIFQQFF